jgi:hypothetical protein
VTHDDPIITGKIALAHMKEFPDYYERLADESGPSSGRRRTAAPANEILFGRRTCSRSNGRQRLDFPGTLVNSGQ